MSADSTGAAAAAAAAPPSLTERAEEEQQQATSHKEAAARQRITSLVGLYNQGATCYLNSLLQALYMTPEFRRMVFAWRAAASTPATTMTSAAEEQSANGTTATGSAQTAGVNGVASTAASAGAMKRSVPYQLQLLFARLSLSRSRSAVDTAALTHAFGWSSADNFRQHDVQELMRVLFGALELAWSTPGPKQSLGAPTADGENGAGATLASLYTGRLLDAVECCSCGTRRERVDIFQDLSLSVSGCPTLRDSLKAFVAPEKLEADNALRCTSEKCGGSKQPALKGLSLLGPLPVILTFQLKRFVFDFRLLQRVKLNDAFDFPQRIDMAEFLSPARPPAASEDATKLPSPSPSSSSTVYELFAILMHSGVAMGGHYYAYLRSAADGLFHEFNDAHVWALSDGVAGAIKHARGGQEGKSGASAYMLMYRRVDEEEEQQQQQHQSELKAANSNGCDGSSGVCSDFDSLLSDDVRALIAAEEAQYEYDQVQAELERRTMQLTVHVQAGSSDDAIATPAQPAEQTDKPVQHAQQATMTATFRLDCGTSLTLLLQQLRESFPSALSPSTPLHCLRLRKYDPSLRWASTVYGDGPAAHSDSAAPSAAGDEQLMTLEKAGMQKINTLLLEVRKEGEEWPPYAPDTLPLRCVFVTPINVSTLVDQSLHPVAAEDVFLISVSKSASVADLRTAVVEGANKGTPAGQAVPAPENLRLVLLHESHTQLVKEDPAAPTLQSYDLYPGRWLYVEHAREDELLRPTFERLRCQIEICFNEPPELPPAPSAADASSSSLDDTAAAAAAAGSVPVFQPSYSRSVRASKNETLAVLKARIAASLGLDVSEFRVSRTHTAPQFKDMSQTLGELQLVDQSGIFVSRGRPLENDEALVKFFLLAEEEPPLSDPAAAEAAAVAAAAAGPSSGVAASRFQPLFELPVRVSTPIKELKHTVLTFLSRRRPGTIAGSNGWGIEHVRIRDKKGASSKNVLEDAKTLAENVGPHLLEDAAGLELVLQRLEQEEVWTKDLMMLQLQRWMPRTQKLGAIEDFVVRKNISVGAAKAQISRMVHPGTRNTESSGHTLTETTAATSVPTIATSSSSSPPSLPPIFLAKGKMVGRMKRADVAKLTWIGGGTGGEKDAGNSSSDDTKLLRNALALRSGELMLFYEGLSEVEQAAAKAAKEKKAAAAAAAAAATAATTDDPSAASCKPVAAVSSATALKPWQRGAAARVRKAAGVSSTGAGVSLPSRPAPVEHGLRIGLSPEQEAAAAREDEKNAAAAAKATEDDATDNNGQRQ